MPLPPLLPIDKYLPEIAEKLKGHRNLVIRATPGSGKTTRVPPYLAQRLSQPGKQVWVLEPRRLAAKLSAFRVSEEMGRPVGTDVGYHFRFEKSFSPQTRLLFLTEGMFLRRLLSDPKVSETDLLILDEFHERSLATDVAIAAATHLQKTSRPDLRIVVMSATLEEEKVGKYLGDCPILSVEAPRFPIDIRYVDTSQGTSQISMEDRLAKAMPEILRETKSGDVLVFLPGMREIRKSQELISRTNEPVVIFPLHGELSREEQELALRPHAKRKIILSTNIAETSLTIDGVSVVVDSGMQRSASFSHWSGLSRLSTKAISKASAIQRAGRAGRQGPGFCFRLYSKHDFDHRPAFEAPEITRSDLTQTVLELIRLGFSEMNQVPWFEPPSPQSLQAALSILIRLGAIRKNEGLHLLTDIGNRLVEFPAHPRLARMLLEAEKWGVVEKALPLAALIQDGDLPDGNVIDSKVTPALSFSGKRFISQVRPLLRSDERKDSADGISRALLAGFPDRVAKVRASAKGELEFLLSEGGVARSRNSALHSEELVVLLDVVENKNERTSQVTRTARSFVPCCAPWLWELPNNPIELKEEAVWDATSQRIRLYSRVTYGQLVLENEESHDGNSSENLKLMVEEAIGVPLALWKERSPTQFCEMMGKFWGKEEIEVLLARIFLVGGDGDQTNPTWDAIRHGTDNALQGIRSVKELGALDWSSLIINYLPADLPSRVARAAPTHFELPSGRRAKIEYRLDRKPWLESRLQDFFGMKKTPAILEGKLPLTVHLLAPNYRAVQVTQDLEGFWVRDYPRIRKELSRQYPRHAWPESPDKPLPPRPKR